MSEIFVKSEGFTREVSMGITAEQIVKDKEEIVMSN